jgi:hypothetical protein
MVARDSVDVEDGLNALILEIDRGLAKLNSQASGSADPDVTHHLDTAVDPSNI